MKDDQKGSSKILIQLDRPYPILILAMVMFGGAAAFFFHRASTNGRGLIINGIIQLDPGQADVLYAVFGALSAGMALLGLLSVYHCARIKEFRILIGKKTIKMPSTVLWRGSAEVTIPIDRIAAIVTQPPEKPAVIAIHVNDEVHRIPVRWLPAAWSVQEVSDLIIQRVRQVRQPSPSRDNGDGKGLRAGLNVRDARDARDARDDGSDGADRGERDDRTEDGAE